MNRLLITLLLISSATIFSQELDEAYLESLPDNIREDVLLKIDQRDKDEKPIYRRQSSMTDKPEARKKTNRFGDNIFDTMQSSFMPINEPNLDSSYILDFGDTLELQLIGQKNSNFNGHVAKLEYYNDALDHNQIASYYQSNKDSLPKDMLSYSEEYYINKSEL